MVLAIEVLFVLVSVSIFILIHLWFLGYLSGWKYERNVKRFIKESTENKKYVGVRMKPKTYPYEFYHTWIDQEGKEVKSEIAYYRRAYYDF